MQYKTLFYTLILSCLFNLNLCSQENIRLISGSEKNLISDILQDMADRDQKYRSSISAGTTDPAIQSAIDSVFNNEGIAEGFKYKKSLNLQLSKQQIDSLWSLQHREDLHNHMTLRGLFAAYGYIPESIIKENNYIQLVTLLHPPKDWNIASYLKSYEVILRPEVKKGNMPPKSFATFHDNMKVKILKQPQLYGTMKAFNPSTMKEGLPAIENILATNEARSEIGLPILLDGEYEILQKQ